MLNDVFIGGKKQAADQKDIDTPNACSKQKELKRGRKERSYQRLCNRHVLESVGDDDEAMRLMLRFILLCERREKRENGTVENNW